MSFLHTFIVLYRASQVRFQRSRLKPFQLLLLIHIRLASSAVNTVALKLAMRQKVYCSGSLLEAVQRMAVFPDCKHFVDMPMKTDTLTTLMNWESLEKTGLVDLEKLTLFVKEHFSDPGGELDEVHPNDFSDQARNFDEIKDDKYREWACHLHNKWPSLCRKVSMSVTENPERYSLISVPFPFIVPGGRFREMYYWDSFFTIKGLLASKMFETTKGMMYNMKHLIDLFGFVPNGNRVYYLNRSQPPLLTWCVYEYWKATGDATFVAEILPTLRKEMDFFDRNRRVQCEGWPTALYRYQVVVTGPRPESFREDEECAAHIQDEEGKRRLWGDIAAAAESGRDFSCRWLLDHIQTGDLTVKGMATTRTSELVPVDLNAIMCGNMKMLSELYAVVGDVQESHWAMEKFNLLKEAIHQVLWNEEEGCWFDFDLKKKEHVDAFFDTNLFPLYTHSFHQDLNAASVLKYLEKVNVLSFPGGLPSSLVRSGQQWDFPNGWAPTTWIVIQGLLNIRLDEVAFKLADKWIRKNYAMWCNSGGKMFEKYDVEDGCDEGKAATGGEFSKGR